VTTSRFILGALAGAALLIGGCKSSERSYDPAVKDDLRVVTARVEAINPTTRVVRLNGEQGPADIVVPPEVRNFDQIKVGDSVQISYYTGVAAQLRKKGDPVTGPTDEIVAARAEPGAKPGAAVGRNISTTVTILSIDTKVNTVKFKRPDGEIKEVAVESEEGKKFIKTLKPNDEVDITYTEAVAVEVVPAAK
jgi:hypothetical protein